MLERASSSRWSRTIAVAIVALIGLGGLACTRTVAVYLRPDISRTEARPTVLAAYRVRILREKNESSLNLSREQLAELGQNALPRLEKVFRHLGFAPELNPAARALDPIEQVVPDTLERIEGVWTHPDTAYSTFDRDGEGANPRAAKTLGRVLDAPYFASATILLVDERAGVTRAPRVELAFRVIDRKGDTVAVGLTEGAGEAKAVAPDTTLGNLLLAVDRAVDAALTAQLRSLSAP